MIPSLGAPPLVIAIAGANGAGKTTFFETILRSAGLLFVNADTFARELSLEPYAAARLAEFLRRSLRSAILALCKTCGTPSLFYRTSGSLTMTICFIRSDW